MSEPVFFLLAGPNGAGKSSLYRAAVNSGLIAADAEFVNADIYEREHLAHMLDAQKRSEAARDWADQRRASLLESGRPFVSETVFSHPSKLLLITQAQAKGYQVVLLVVCLDDPQRLLLRVQQRVREGGHDVPAQRILDRYPRTITNLTQAVRMADLAMLYDSGTADAMQVNRLKRVAVCKKHVTHSVAELLPGWAQQVLGLQSL